MRRNLCTITGVCLALVAGTAFAKPTPAQKCESDKNKLAGQYAFCRDIAGVDVDEPLDRRLVAHAGAGGYRT